MKKMYGTIPFEILKKHVVKVKELAHYANFVADDAISNTLTIYIIKKDTKNDKQLHQVIKLARQN